MKNLLRLSLLGLVIIGSSANASLDIKSIELNDSTFIDILDIQAINVHNTDSTIESVETISGSIIDGSEISKVHFLRSFNTRFGIKAMASKSGGEGSGG
jgi:hypothetical protein